MLTAGVEGPRWQLAEARRLLSLAQRALVLSRPGLSKEAYNAEKAHLADMKGCVEGAAAARPGVQQLPALPTMRSVPPMRFVRTCAACGPRPEGMLSLSRCLLLQQGVPGGDAQVGAVASRLPQGNSPPHSSNSQVCLQSSRHGNLCLQRSRHVNLPTLYTQLLCRFATSVRRRAGTRPSVQRWRLPGAAMPVAASAPERSRRETALQPSAFQRLMHLSCEIPMLVM